MIDMTANLAQCEVTATASADLDLVHAAQNGNAQVFGQLVSRYDRKLLRIAQHVTHNREDAQDAVQEAFFKAYQHLDKFREDSRFSTWLIRITLNQALMKVRKQRRAAKEVSMDGGFKEGEMLPLEIADWAPDPEERYGASELRAILVKTLEELPSSLRTVFALRDIEGLSINETAEVLNLSSTAVKARLWRTRLQLRQRLSKYFRRPRHDRHSTAEPNEARGVLSPPELSHGRPGCSMELETSM
jgi:RNA polymerase sigma-70 factor, ECF subfamily